MRRAGGLTAPKVRADQLRGAWLIAGYVPAAALRPPIAAAASTIALAQRQWRRAAAADAAAIAATTAAAFFRARHAKVLDRAGQRIASEYDDAGEGAPSERFAAARLRALARPRADAEAVEVVGVESFVRAVLSSPALELRLGAKLGAFAPTPMPGGTPAGGAPPVSP